MKLSRYRWLALAVGAALVVVAGAVPWSFWGKSVRLHIAHQIRQATGLETEANGRLAIALLPRPHVKLENVRIADRWNTLNIDVQILKGDLRLLPLIAGRLELSSLSFYLPTISLDIYGRPLMDRGAIARASTVPPASPEAKTADAARLGVITIQGGRILLRGGNEKEVHQLGDVNATLNWKSIRSPASLTGSLIFSGEKCKLSAFIGKPSDLLRAQSSPIRVELTSRLLDLSLDGTLSSGPRWQYAGKMTSSSKALRSLLSLTGLTLPIPGPLHSFSVSAQANMLEKGVSLSSMKLTLDENTFDGSLAVRKQDKRHMVSGTLATQMLSIYPRSSNLPALTGPGRRWNKAPLSLAGLSIADMDLRLSAEQFRFGRITLADLGVTALLKNSALQLSAVSSKAYGGTFNARLEVARGPAIPSIKGMLRFRDIATGDLLADASRGSRFSGNGTGQIEFRSAGTNVAEMVRLLGGKLDLELKNGAIRGIDIGLALRKASSQPLSIPSQVRGGETSFSSANALANIKEGKLALISSALKGAGYSVDVRGSIDLPNKYLNLGIVARPQTDQAAGGASGTARAAAKPAAAGTQEAGKGAAAPDGGKQGPGPLEIDLVGDWNDPTLMADPESLIRRSKAAAPLLRTFRRLRGLTAQTPPLPGARPAAVRTDGTAPDSNPLAPARSVAGE